MRHEVTAYPELLVMRSVSQTQVIKFVRPSDHSLLNTRVPLSYKLWLPSEHFILFVSPIQWTRERAFILVGETDPGHKEEMGVGRNMFDSQAIHLGASWYLLVQL